MKKLLTALLCVVLALAMSLACFADLGLSDFEDSDGEDKAYDESVFWVDEPDDDLLPGMDYYLETNWGSDAIDDSFFDQYTITQSIQSDTAGVNNATFRKYITAAEFVKGTDGNYYYHIGVSSAAKNTTEVSGGIIIYAKDKLYPDERAACILEFTIGYYSGSDEVDDEEYTMADGGAVLEFDKSLDRCVITFDNDSTLRLKFGSGSKYRYNLCYGEDVNTNIESANPKAKITQMTFYGRPKFPEAFTFKYYAGDNAKYFYELGEDGTLTLLSTSNANGYFGISTKVLGTYIASDIALNDAAVNASSPTAAGSTASAATSTTDSSVVVSDSSKLPQNPSTGAAV